VEDHAHQLVRRDLHPGRPHDAPFLVFDKGFFKVAVGLVGAEPEAHRILHRHRGALRHVLQHEVRGVAEEGDAPAAPVVDRLAVQEHPAAELLRRAHQLERLVAVMREERQHLVGLRELVVPAARVLSDDGGDQVEELPAAQRVVDDVRVVRRPERRGREPQILGHVLDVEHRAVAHVPGNERQRVSHDAFADHRSPAVRANEGNTADGIFLRSCNDSRSIILKPRDARARPQLDQLGQRLAAIEERAVNVGAVCHRVRVAEALREALVERDVDHLVTADPVEHQEMLDENRLLLHQPADPERVERVPGVGRDLDAGADLAELRGLLEHHRAEPLARQRERRGEPADAAAGDDDRPFVSRLHAAQFKG